MENKIKTTAVVDLTATDNEDGSTVSNNQFAMEMTDEEAKAVASKAAASKRIKLTIKFFKAKVKQAVIDWFNKDKDDLIDAINQYGGGYEYDADDGESEISYALSRFTIRLVEYIPDELLEKNGIREQDPPDVNIEDDYLNPFLDD